MSVVAWKSRFEGKTTKDAEVPISVTPTKLSSNLFVVRLTILRISFRK